jgi:hypothetical protein
MYLYINKNNIIFVLMQKYEINHITFFNTYKLFFIYEKGICKITIFRKNIFSKKYKVVYYTTDNIFDIVYFIKKKYHFFSYISNSLIKDYFLDYLLQKYNISSYGLFTNICNDEDNIKITSNAVIIIKYKNEYCNFCIML